MQTQNTDLFDGCLGATPEGKARRETIKVEDVILCQIKERSEQISKYLEDTMAFVAGFDNPDK